MGETRSRDHQVVGVENLAKEGGGDGEVREEDHENGSLVEAAPPIGPTELALRGAGAVLDEESDLLGRNWVQLGVY